MICPKTCWFARLKLENCLICDFVEHDKSTVQISFCASFGFWRCFASNLFWSLCFSLGLMNDFNFQGKGQDKGQSQTSTCIGFQEASNQAHQEPSGRKGNRKTSCGPTWRWIWYPSNAGPSQGGLQEGGKEASGQECRKEGGKEAKSCRVDVRGCTPKRGCTLSRREQLVEKRTTAWQFRYVLNALGSAFDITGWTTQKITAFQNCFSCVKKQKSFRCAKHTVWNLFLLRDEWTFGSTLVRRSIVGRAVESVCSHVISCQNQHVSSFNARAHVPLRSEIAIRQVSQSSSRCDWC